MICNIYIPSSDPKTYNKYSNRLWTRGKRSLRISESNHVVNSKILRLHNYIRRNEHASNMEEMVGNQLTSGRHHFQVKLYLYSSTSPLFIKFICLFRYVLYVIED